jgi:predicted transcriptional regulator
MDDASRRQELLSLTTEIVASFAGHNAVAMDDLPALISNVFEALRRAGQAEEEKPAEAPVPAVPVKKSVGRDFLVCLEDGQKVTMLKRHLARRHQMTPEAYRRRWDLAKDYPMVPPVYAERRSALAKQIGLGRKKPAAAPQEAAPEPATAAEGQGSRHSARGRRKAA